MMKTYEEPYAQAISHFRKHGFKNQVSRLKVIDCKAILTLGFGMKPSGRLPELQQCIEERLAEGRSDDAFWKSMSGVGDSGGTALPASTAPQLIVVSD